MAPMAMRAMAYIFRMALRFNVHCANPVGRESIDTLPNAYLTYRDRLTPFSRVAGNYRINGSRRVPQMSPPRQTSR
jgi:hypothetical protein